ncbi:MULTISPECIES: hypothetical protein [unclassified Viridibacillus]|uniref:hypothetical protein n=1 Tax=unclassified Viridibacillus TaxID=2617942 RepID=UPI00096F29FD|nr:hypothetical protein [Viridibacillus sp. FSL H8-0123]OMC84556.1 hypothetical protein BK130_02735 [Viridibacillus sp. FSL H8-0123]
MRKRKAFVLTIVLVVLVGMGIYIYGQYKTFGSVKVEKTPSTEKVKKTTLSVKDLFWRIDFNEKDSYITVEKIPSLATVEISEETQKELLKAFENAKFKKMKMEDSNIDLHYNYLINISVSGYFALFVDSSNKIIYVDETQKKYIMVDDNDFFDILENAVKK